MKNKLLQCIVALATLTFLGHYFVKPAWAAITAALVKNIDERGRNPYNVEVQCFITNNSICYNTAAPVPPNMRLVVEHINASIDAPTANPLSHVDFSGNGTIDILDMHVGGFDTTGNNIYIENQPLLTYFEAGQTPLFDIQLTGSSPALFISASFRITGYLVNLSQ